MDRRILLMWATAMLLLADAAQAQWSGLSNRLPERRETAPVLFELQGASESAKFATGDVPINIDILAIQRGSDLQVKMNGRLYEFSFERISQNDDSVTWIGAVAGSEEDRIYVSLTEDGIYASWQVDEEQYYVAPAEVGERLRGPAAGPFPRVGGKGYKNHLRVVALDRLDPTRIRIDRENDRVERLRASRLGTIEVDRVLLTDDFKDVLKVSGEVDLRQYGAGNFTVNYSERRSYRFFQQYIRGIRVDSYIRFNFDPYTFAITEFDGTIFAQDEAPPRGVEDLGKNEALDLVLLELAQETGVSTLAAVTDPELTYYPIGGRLRLGWSTIVTHSKGAHVTFVDAKSGTTYVGDLLQPTHTCTVAGIEAEVASCDEPEASIIIDATGQCINDCGGAIEAAHRDARDYVDLALQDFHQHHSGGYAVDPDVGIVSDSTWLSPNIAAGTITFPDDEAQIYVRDMAALQSGGVMVHEAAHVFVGAKNPALRQSPAEEPLKATLSEGIAYILQETTFGIYDELEHPNAHVENYVDDEDMAAQNSEILQQAIYTAIATDNDIDLEVAHDLIIKAIWRISPSCSGCAPKVGLDRLRDAMRDVLADQKDSGAITGPVERARRDDLYEAFGAVGIGRDAQPPGGSPPPPPPVPGTPFVNVAFEQCSASGLTWWRVDWIPVPNADYYPAFSTGEVLELIVYSPPFWIWVNNSQTAAHVHACGPAGCSGHSNEVFVNDVCGGG